ncbi:MAG: OmpA family protein [Phycisphaerales bacterium]|nr:OmpA family protein [Phycisphaerales bacterium]
MSAEKEHDQQEHPPHASHAPHGGGSHEEHEGAPEWLISFADNVALMMGFFVILLALNMGPKGGGDPNAKTSGATAAPTPDMIDLFLSIRESFNNPVDLNSMDPDEEPLVRRLLERRGRAQTLDDGPPGDDHEVQSLRPSKHFSTCGSVRFEPGDKALSEAATKDVREIARHIRGLRLVVNVLGHVSAAEAHDSADMGMQLSFDRAMAVAGGLKDIGMDWKQLRIIVCGDNDRIAPTAYDSAGHTRNQRVEVVLTDEVIPGDVRPPHSDSPSTAHDPHPTPPANEPNHGAATDESNRAAKGAESAHNPQTTETKHPVAAHPSPAADPPH